MEIELIKNKIYYRIFDLHYQSSTARYSKHKAENKLASKEIENNINAIKNEYKTKELSILKQVHGTKIINVDDLNLDKQYEADGSITTKKNVVLAILTADCVPVLLTDDNASIIGAVHCGWRSAKNGIIANIKQEITKHGAKNIKAVIGPAIHQNSYEVDSSYHRQFILDDKKNQFFFIKSKNQGHYMFDLPGYVKYKLEKENIKIAEFIDENTYQMADKYPSYRRSTHNHEEYRHNILSTIVMR